MFKIVENPIAQLLVIISVVIFFWYKCTNSPSSDSKPNYKVEKKNIIKNGIVTVSIFKTKESECHIWTSEEIKSTNQADLLRANLGLYEDGKMYLYSDSTLDEGHYYASHLSILSKNPLQSFSGKSKGSDYIENGDTIKLMPYDESGRICNVYTNRRMYNRDMLLMDRAIKSLKIQFENVIFLFTDNNHGEDYYATYTKSSIHQRETTEQALSQLIAELKSARTISGTGGIFAFLAKIEQAEKKILSSGDMESKNKIGSALSSFQKRHFPIARKAYYKNAKDELWEKNIEVSMSGRDITFTGYMFVDNKVKKDTYLEIKDELTKLRFKSVGFRAFDGDDKTYWDLDSENDSEI